MLSNDESKRLMLRFKKSKDFNKLCKKLEKEGYKVFKSDTPIIENEKNTNRYMILVGKGPNCLIGLEYEKNTNKESEYKENIFYISY